MIKGEIYCITNQQTNKHYIGQTRSHRKNHGSYKPFGSTGRFKDHISEALCNTKKNQCRYLNSAIRKYGAENFDVIVLEECEVSELNDREEFYIAQYNSMYPNGYNLTAGGRTTRSIRVEKDVDPLPKTKPRGGCTNRSEQTRSVISEKLKQALTSKEVRICMSERTRQQHLMSKLEKYIGVEIDSNNLDKYIHQQANRVVVMLNKQKITFASKHATQEERYTHARNFLLQICNVTKLRETP